MGLTLAPLQAADIPEIAMAFAELGWPKPAAQYERYLREQERGEREVIVARLDGRFAGYLTILWRSGYAPFREARIPEIADFNVLPRDRRRGIGTRLMEAAEARIAAHGSFSGIGVGMTADYGAAQILYVKRGYVPDGRGLAWRGLSAGYGTTVTVDDDLVLYLMKELRA